MLTEEVMPGLAVPGRIGCGAAVLRAEAGRMLFVVGWPGRAFFAAANLDAVVVPGAGLAPLAAVVAVEGRVTLEGIAAVAEAGTYWDDGGSVEVGK